MDWNKISLNINGRMGGVSMRALELSYASNVNYTIPKLAKAGKQRGVAHAPPPQVEIFFWISKMFQKTKSCFETQQMIDSNSSFTKKWQ